MDKHGQIYFDAQERIPPVDRERFRQALEEDRERAAHMLEEAERRELIRQRMELKKRSHER